VKFGGVSGAVGWIGTDPVTGNQNQASPRGRGHPTGSRRPSAGTRAGGEGRMRAPGVLGRTLPTSLQNTVRRGRVAGLTLDIA
jgi:hypothetical protein